MAAKSEILKREHVQSMDPIWDSLRSEARFAADHDPLLAAFLYSTVLNHHSLEDCVIYRICERLDHPDLQAILLRQTFDEMLRDWPEWGSIMRVDIQAVYDRDPACTRFMEPVLYFKGFHAIQTHRLAHWLWNRGRRDFALYLQSRASSVFQTDINPAPYRQGSSSITPRPRCRRDGADRRQRLHPARRHARRHGQGGGGPPPQDRRRRADRCRRQGAWQYRGRLLLAHSRRLGGAEARAARLDGRRRSGPRRG